MQGPDARAGGGGGEKAALLPTGDDAAAVPVGQGVGLGGCVGPRVVLAAAIGFVRGGVDGVGQLAFEITLGDGGMKVDAEMLLKTPAQDVSTLKSRHAAVPHG